MCDGCEKVSEVLFLMQKGKLTKVICYWCRINLEKNKWVLIHRIK